MSSNHQQLTDLLFQPLQLPCGVVLKNRLAKSAMSDSLGDGTGNPTLEQMRLYERWAEGGVAVSIIGEVQSTSKFAEKPGNLVLDLRADFARFQQLAQRASVNQSLLWPQIGHAGAMAYPAISSPKGPSALDYPQLKCTAMTRDEIGDLPIEFAQSARLAKSMGFAGVQIHAAHGFVLSQFLSPLFNRRTDAYGGDINARMRLLLEVIDEVRCEVGPDFAVAVKINASDQLAGGLDTEDALDVVEALDRSGADLIDISGGTYFPGAKSASDSGGTGPYFIQFAKSAKQRTRLPVMVTGGFKTAQQAGDALSSGAADVIGLARAMVLNPQLPTDWQNGRQLAPEFPRFAQTVEGGVTAWYTMRMTQLAQDADNEAPVDMLSALQSYEARDNERVACWNTHFAS